MKKIDSTKVGIKDFFQIALDYEMLGLFCKSIFAYIVCATTLCVFYLIFIYFLNKALWHEYFPIEDLSDVDLNDDIRINDELWIAESNKGNLTTAIEMGSLWQGKTYLKSAASLLDRQYFNRIGLHFLKEGTVTENESHSLSK